MVLLSTASVPQPDGDGIVCRVRYNFEAPQPVCQWGQSIINHQLAAIQYSTRGVSIWSEQGIRIGTVICGAGAKSLPEADNS